MGYFTYYLAWLALSYALHRPALMLGVLVILALRPVLPDPLVLLRTWGRIRALDRQIAANPANVTARRDLAEIWIERLRPRRALQLLDEARERDPARRSCSTSPVSRDCGRATRRERLSRWSLPSRSTQSFVTGNRIWSPRTPLSTLAGSTRPRMPSSAMPRPTALPFKGTCGWPRCESAGGNRGSPRSPARSARNLDAASHAIGGGARLAGGFALTSQGFSGSSARRAQRSANKHSRALGAPARGLGRMPRDKPLDVCPA